MKVLIKVYENVKYDEVVEEVREVIYDNVESFEVVSDYERVREIEQHTDGSCIDEYHEYLVLHFKDGETGTFRNSHADLFRLR